MQRLFLFFTFLVTLSRTHGAPALTLSSSSVASNFEGAITYTISGVTPGETVFVERIMDLNENGAVDAGETSLRSFSVTDGGQIRIGGVRNVNVPDDEDGVANGTIDLRLDFAGVSPILNRQTGKFVIRVTAGSGQATALFEVTAPNLPEQITGQIQNTNGGAPVPFAFVIILVGDGEAIGSVRANATGHYRIAAPPGDYALIPFADGFVGSFNGAPLRAGQNVAQNLTLTPESIRVSGRVSDVDSGATGLPGIFVLAQSDPSGLFSGGLTDANGNYTFTIAPGEFEIRPLEDFVSQLGYLTPRNGSFINPPAGSGPITLNFALPKATALIYGTVKDAGNNAPIAGLRLNSDDEALISFEGDGRTSASGDYVIGVRAGDWQVRVEDAESLGYGRAETNVTILDGQAIRADLRLAKATAHVRGKVVDARGVGLANVQVEGQIGNNFSAASSTTDSQGNFDLGLWGGAWTIHLGNLNGSGLIEHYVSVIVVDGVDQTINYVIPDSTGQINGMVKNQGGAGIGNLQLSAEASINGVLYRSAVTTDQGGAYTLPVINGSWSIYFNCQQLQDLDFQCPQSSPTVINSNNANVNFTLAPRVVTSPTIENPVLDRSGPTPTVRFVLRGVPGTYEILGTAAIPGGWGFVSSVTIQPGNDTALVSLTPGSDRFFQARVQQ